MPQDILAYPGEIEVYIVVGVSQHREPLVLQERVPFGILPLVFLLKMLRSVQLDDDFFFGDVKIYDVRAQDFLPFAFMPHGFRKSYHNRRSSFVMDRRSFCALAVSFGLYR